MMTSPRKPSTIQCNVDTNPAQALLIFPVADKWFALPLDSVRAVLTADLLRTFLGSADSLAGWLEIQGQEVLVLDMTQTLVPGAVSAAAQQIILLRAGDSLTGLTTTGTSETISIPAGRLEQVSDHAPEWALGFCQADGRTVTVLDPEMFAGSLSAAC